MQKTNQGLNSFQNFWTHNIFLKNKFVLSLKQSHLNNSESNQLRSKTVQSWKWRVNHLDIVTNATRTRAHSSSWGWFKIYSCKLALHEQLTIPCRLAGYSFWVDDDRGKVKRGNFGTKAWMENGMGWVMGGGELGGGREYSWADEGQNRENARSSEKMELIC